MCVLLVSEWNVGMRRFASKTIFVQEIRGPINRRLSIGSQRMWTCGKQKPELLGDPFMQTSQLMNRQVQPGEMLLQIRQSLFIARGENNRTHPRFGLPAEPLKRLLSQFEQIVSLFLTGFEGVPLLLQRAALLPERPEIPGLFGEGISQTPDLQHSHSQ